MKTFNLFRVQYFFCGESRAASIGLLCTIGLCLVVPKTTLSQNSVQRDQQAVTILTQTIAAGGGQEVLTSIQDFTETGTVTYDWADQVTGNVTVEGRGLNQLKIEAELSGGTRKAVIDHDGGSLKEADGRTRPILRQSAHDLGSLALPCLPLIAAIQDSSTSLIYDGLVTHNGASVYDIRLQKVYTEQEDPSGIRGKREARDFYIDPRLFLITAISDRIYFGGPSDKGVLHEILYSNYQSEDGIPTPLTIAETVWSVTGFTMQLSQVKFNSGLTDSDVAW